MGIRFFRTESFRVAIVYGLAFLLAMGALSLVALSITERTMQEQIAHRAEADLAVMRAFYVRQGQERVSQYVQHRAEHNTSLDYILLEKNGRKLAGNMWEIPPATGLQKITRPIPPHRNVMGKGALLAPGLYAFSGTDMAYIDIIRAQVFTVLFWMFGGILVLAPLGGFLLSRRFLARTDAIARTCQEIMAGNLSTRIPLHGQRDEMDRLASSINAMLDRIAGLMENLRQVSSDVAHDLRTPLSHLRHGLERARGEAATPQDYAAALDRAIAASDELLALFAALLRITQIESGARRSGFAPVDLAELLRRIEDMYHAVADDADHVLTVEAPPCTIRGDRDLLFQMLSNLVENAIVHTPAATRITVSLACHPAEAILSVCDNGPGMPSPEHAKLFQRFYRGEASRTRPGNGLGLALAQAVAELHGGNIKVATPRQGQGTEMRVTLPISGA